MKKDDAESTILNCECKTEGLFVFAFILITGSLLFFTLILIFDKTVLVTVPKKSKTEYSIEKIKVLLYKKTKIILQPEESSIEK